MKKSPSPRIANPTIKKNPATAEPISIHGARMHNLKNVSLDLPRNQLIVLTGVSGSGKSSLAIHTLFAEGQRRYAESLNAYARQFFMRLPKPDVDSIKGLSPAIAIEQKVTSHSARSTVGTMTEIYDYLKILFAKIGITYAPDTGEEIRTYNVEDVLNILMHELSAQTKIDIAFNAQYKDDTPEKVRKNLLGKSFTSIRIAGKKTEIEKVPSKIWAAQKTYHVVVDSLNAADLHDKDGYERAWESLEIAFDEGAGVVEIYINDSSLARRYAQFFSLDGEAFPEPCEALFSFNSPLGACPFCQGYGQALHLDPKRIIPDPRLSIMQDAVAPWKGAHMSRYKKRLIEVAKKSDIPLFTPISDFTPKAYKTLWEGNAYFSGINDFFADLERDNYKMHYRVLIARYKSRSTCPECGGARLRKESLLTRINNQKNDDDKGENIAECAAMPAEKLLTWIQTLTQNIDAQKQQLVARVLVELQTRLQTLVDVGLGYLSLERPSATLSGGESQRVKLTLSLGSNLSDALYILDEPSIGLHARDTERLVSVLRNLRDLGNTVIVVEHDETMMQNADHIVDMGPLASYMGGEVVFEGSYPTLLKNKKSITAKYLREPTLQILRTPAQTKTRGFIQVENASTHNLQNVKVKFPLGVLCAVTGVSGSGKSSLVRDSLYPALREKLNPIHNAHEGKTSINSVKLSGDTSKIQQIEMIDQNPIGKSSRSNPVSYIGAFDLIRQHFARTGESTRRGYTAGRFSYNTPGGRCEHCQGTGEQTITMQFLADINLPCEHCGGKRYRADTLEIKYKNKNIYDVLQMSVDEAIAFYADDKKIAQALQPLADVGLGYMRLGQSSASTSGGEAQRIKLASYLSAGSAQGAHLFIFDEPTTGLHFHDIEKLIKAFDALLTAGHSIIVVEHNTMLIKNADWVIELGPEAGDKGGRVIFEGTPEALRKRKDVPTAQFL